MTETPFKESPVQNQQRQSANFIMPFRQANTMNETTFSARQMRKPSCDNPSKRLRLLMTMHMYAPITFASSRHRQPTQSVRRPTSPGFQAPEPRTRGGAESPRVGRPLAQVHLPQVAIEPVDDAVIVGVAHLPGVPLPKFTFQMSRSRLFTTPSRLKSPAYVAITVTVCASGSSNQPSVNPVPTAVES